MRPDLLTLSDSSYEYFYSMIFTVRQSFRHIVVFTYIYCRCIKASLA